MSLQSIRTHFDPLFDRMLRAGWLARYTFTEGSGYSHVWELKGLRIIRCLRVLADALRIHDDLEFRARLAAVFAHCGGAPFIAYDAQLAKAIEHYRASGLVLGFRSQDSSIVPEWTRDGRHLFDQFRAAMNDVSIEENIDDAQFLFVVAAQYDPGADIRFVQC